MKTLVKQYRQFRAMENEIHALRAENEELKRWLDMYEQAETERRQDSKNYWRDMFELCKAIDIDKLSDTN